MRSFTIKSMIWRGACIILIAVLLLGQSVFAASSAEDDRNQQYLQGVIDMIREDYGGTQSDKQLLQGSLKGMLGSLDPYTTYYTPTEADSYMGSVTGVFGGIGVNLEIAGDYIVITKVFPLSPAEKAGILQGDKIVEADGKKLLKITTGDAVSTLKGKPGTKVKLGILRDDSKTVKYVEVVREIVQVNPVTFEIRNGIGYIKLEEFNENTSEFIAKALAAMDAKRITKIVLDLRDNPGGEVGQAVLMAQNFVPKGLITVLDYKSEQIQDMKFSSYLEEPKYKLVVLVNGNSASASEIVAGAIQDTGAGTLIGTKTFGKAKFQELIPILTPEAFDKYSKQTGSKTVNVHDLQNSFNIQPSKDEIAGYAKMTMGFYYTPKGRMIDGKGLMPDISVPDPKPVADIAINGIQTLTKTARIGLDGHGIDVYNAEKILKVLGYKTGDIDTKLDSKTFSAIKVYQKAKKLTVNGKLDSRTQDALNAELRKLITKYDTQYDAAVKILDQNGAAG